MSYDLVIVGGGLVGGSLACALAETGLRLCVVEAVPPRSEAQPSYDERVIALSWGSRRIFEDIGLWETIVAGAEPIRQVHVSDRGRFGFTRLDHREEGVAALGYVAPARRLGQAIQDGLAGVEMLCPARLLGVRVQRERVALEVTVGNTSRLLETRLLVAADGGDSSVRGRLGLAVREHGYGHDALITTVTPERPRPGVAFERFTETGPLALLPMTEGRYSVVWTMREGEAAGLLNLSDREFLAGLQGRFGYRLGKFTRPGRRLTYPLRLILAREPVGRRLVLVGNAAHTLHPVAGQGFNLGLRDVAALAEVLVQAAHAGDDPGGDRTLDAYRRLRGWDQTAVVAAIDALARIFVNPWLPVRWARGLGLLGLGLSPGLRHLVARHFMGLAGGSQPWFARGLPSRTGRSNNT
ncbi:2-octaprenyl-6-methoxyphenyl hydroxylase [Candidatus Thiosymbion oneisti]|uniref:2-octaprenyl-6-methoxyphenyl hydroxylase n=1 Tax=Candidatus Thiosymbion oneisti TaxID=589554 RepID=UPI000AE0DE09|nr:2-octaprenyl-6-methoxyphenyl hydroxylase [Candidatus Thiosymbion oneisti]